MAHPVIPLRVQTHALHADAPPKPAPGAACNGCGVCCTWQPCPLGMLVSGRRTGVCSALRWQASPARYVCGLLNAPQAVWPRLPTPLHPMLQHLARRWIAAGAGCDSDLVVEPPELADQAAKAPASR